MSNTQCVPVPGSDREPVAGAKYVSPVQHSEEIRVTVILRRRGGEPALGHEGKAHNAFRSRQEYGTIHGADPRDIDAVEQFAHENGLTVVERHEASRRVVLAGPANAVQKAFEVELGVYDVAQRGFHYRGRKGSVCLPPHLEPVVMAVLGLDNRPVAKPHNRRKQHAHPQAQSASFDPNQLAKLYNFPTGVTGSGQTVAIIELGGGYSATDLHTYFTGLGIKTPSVTAVSVDGGKNQPGTDADGEVMLDIEVVGATAPGANIAVYFAPNTDQGFVDAISQAVHDTTRKPSIVSISWGGPEDSWTAQSRAAMNAALQDAGAVGVTVTVAAGDDGSTDGVNDNQLHVDFPASSPYALSCGGTKVVASNGKITSETVWNELTNQEGATGGGVSRFFPLPSYQTSAKVPVQPETKFKGRGVPDVSGDADPVTGYNVLVDGKKQVIGGTSAVAPLWAGLLALVNQHLGTPVGFVNPLLYQIGTAAFRDITSGSNGASGVFAAGPGWDACTGLGSPNGAALLSALQSGSTVTKNVTSEASATMPSDANLTPVGKA
jgi:kumamolisin